jgi:hypothetical protein
MRSVWGRTQFGVLELAQMRQLMRRIGLDGKTRRMPVREEIADPDAERDRKECVALNHKAIEAERELAEASGDELTPEEQLERRRDARRARAPSSRRLDHHRLGDPDDKSREQQWPHGLKKISQQLDGIQSAVALDTAAKQAHADLIFQEIPGATIFVSTDRGTASSAGAPSRST